MKQNLYCTKQGIYSNNIYNKEEKRSQINNLTLHLRELEKKLGSQAQSQQKKGNNKDQSRNKIENIK